MAHTKGPWTARKSEDTAVEWDVMAGLLYVASTFGHAGEGADEANARLIAAAPELLAALTDMIEPWSGFSVQELQRRHLMGAIDTPQLARILAARAAIAKAGA